MKIVFLLIFLLCSFLHSADKQIVLIAGKDSHKHGDHEFRAGCHLLAKKLNESDLPLKVSVVEERSWPESNSVFEKADAIIIYSDGFKKHPLKARKLYHFFDNLAKKGKGIGFMHYACEVEKNQGNWLTTWVGGYYERLFSVNPHWICHSILNKKHPCTKGVANFKVKDEWYFNIRLTDKVKPVLRGIPDKTARSGDTTFPRGPLKHIVDAEGQEETLLWTLEREDGGRGFGFTGGHYHKNWQNDEFRKLILNTIAWTAGLEIPESGIDSTTPTQAEMEENMKPKKKGKK
ncbi:MAG: ThuA domain-containing protein [Lentisphaerales bacterium]|nr:ThuA domain-containing protein [Lentisphaerales bacterium]